VLVEQVPFDTDFFQLLVETQLHSLHRVPQDIEPESPMRGSPISDEIPGAEKPSTPNAAKAAPKDFEPSCPSGTQSSHDTEANLTPPIAQKTSSAKTMPSLSAVDAPHSPRWAESPKMTPPIPRSHGLDSTSGAPLGGDSGEPQPESLPL
jgi:hypothetical protein